MTDANPIPKNPVRPVVAIFLLFLAALLCFAGIVDHDLWNPDEPRVCCISMAMQETRDWVVPRLAGEIFIEKPPLYLWLCGACGRFFGPLFGVVGGARLSTSFCAVGTLAATAWLAFLLRGRRRDAFFAVLALSTMPQFILDMHRMRTDVLLAFCTAATVAFLAHAYLRGRPWSLLPAGLAAAGALLSKGPVGWVLILPATLSLALQAWVKTRDPSSPDHARPSGGRLPWILAHVLALLLAIGLAGLWVWAIYRHDDPSAWKAWFWDNQIGRTTGTATALGHHHPWDIHYYLAHLPGLLGPWIPYLVLWIVRCMDALRAVPRGGRWRAVLRSSAFFPAVWGFGGLLLLTIPSTKRGIYLLPLYPAFALMVADAMPRASGTFFKWWERICRPLPLLFAAGLLLLPVLAPFLPFPMPAPLVQWTPYHAATLLLALLYAACARLPRRIPDAAARTAASLFLASAFFWLLLFGIPFQGRDAQKSMRGATLRVAAALPADTSRVAAYRLDETGRAAFEFFAGVVLTPLDGPRDANNLHLREEAAPVIAEILAGKHPDFTAVLARANHPDEKIWPPSAEVASGTIDGETHYVLSAPAATATISSPLPSPASAPSESP